MNANDREINSLNLQIGILAEELKGAEDRIRLLERDLAYVRSAARSKDWRRELWVDCLKQCPIDVEYSAVIAYCDKALADADERVGKSEKTS